MQINIDTQNDAFAELPGVEIARILREYADKCEAEPYTLRTARLRDRFGNTVGDVTT